MINQLTSDQAMPIEVREACVDLSVSSSGYYAHQHKPERPRRRADAVITQAMHQAFEESGASYGSPRLVLALRKRGLHTSKTRVRRLMHQSGLRPVQRRRESVKTTKSNPVLPVAPHLLRDAPAVQKPGERFYSDITYIPIQEGWIYLAATLDAYSRKCVGWSAADNMEAPLVLRAAVRALLGKGHPEHESQGQLLRQCHDGELLGHP